MPACFYIDRFKNTKYSTCPSSPRFSPFSFFLLSFKSVEWLGLVSTSFITNLCSVTLLLSSFTFYGTHRWQYCRAIRNIMCGYKNASRYIYIATAWHPPCWMSVAWKPPSGCLLKQSPTISKGWISMLYHGVVSVMMLKPPLTMTFFFFALEALLVRFVVRVASLLQACGMGGQCWLWQ